MSDIQEPLIVSPRQVQQRQILAMMGINQWVQPESQTINVADIDMDLATPSQTDYVSSEQPSTAPAIADTPSAAPVSGEMPNASATEPDIASLVTEFTGSSVQPTGDYQYNVDEYNDNEHEKPPVTYSFDSVTHHTPTNSNTAPERTAASFIDEAVQSTTTSPTQHYTAHNDDSSKKVVPFDLQGGRYGDWVILVDIQALNSDSQKLWQNITSALSITCETTSFPICEGMDTAELANASLAGYVFRIGRSEEIQVATLTALPEGLHHPSSTTVPTLDEMLADSSVKRELWQQISH